MAVTLTLRDALLARIRDAQHRGLGRHPVLIEEAGTGPRIHIQGRTLVNFTSNDYLGLSASETWRREVVRCFTNYAPSSSASRLAGGHSRAVKEAEEYVASYFGYADCLILPSGYQANAALVAALVQPGTTVFTDKRIHASTAHALQGTSGADIRPYGHADLAHLERRLEKAEQDLQPLVLTEALFSMDGTVVQPEEFARLKQKYGFFLVADEAHSAGCLGDGGKGVFAAVPGTADVMLCTLGKGFGFFGAFLLLPEGFAHIFEHLSSPVMHSTALPPAHAAAVASLIQNLPNLEGRRAQLAENARCLRELLRARAIPVKGDAHIIAVPVGNEDRASRLGNALIDAGYLALSARFPTVPWGSALLRFGITALHDKQMLEGLADALAEAWQKDPA